MRKWGIGVELGERDRALCQDDQKLFDRIALLEWGEDGEKRG